MLQLVSGNVRILPPDESLQKTNQTQLTDSPSAFIAKNKGQRLQVLVKWD
ncbi:MAG: hypothetical protein ACK5JD_05215 [Mangrovibacterium sp.]